MIGTVVVTTSKLLDRQDDGFNYPIHRAIEDGEAWATENKFFFSGKVRESPENDKAALNANNNYTRRSFVRMDSDATDYSTTEDLKAVVDEVCKVSAFKVLSILLPKWFRN